MRYAIVSDIHANWQAWQAVLTDIASSRVDGIVCLGDILGYGPNPAEVLQSVHRHVAALVLGNHDAVLCNKLAPDLFNAHARRVIDWTRTAVTADATAFLSELPLVLVGQGFRCAHGDFRVPGAFRYVIDPAEALPSWQSTREPLLFAGHSHLPGIFVIGESQVPHRVDPQDFVVEPGKRYLVNVGSVGFPRDSDNRACYCLYDADTATVTWRRVPFDLSGYRAALERAGLPVSEVWFLAQDPLARLPPLREQLNFKPVTRPDEQAQAAVPEQELSRLLRRRLASWKVAAGGLLLAAIVLGLLILARAGHPPAPRVSCPPYALAPRAAYPLPPSIGGAMPNLVPPVPPVVAGGAQLEGWRYFLDDGKRQQIAVDATAGAPLLRAISDRADGHLRIETAPIDLAATGIRRLCMSGQIRRSTDFQGTLSLVLDMDTEKDGTRTRHPRREQASFRMHGAGGWDGARRTFDLLKNTRAVTLAVEGCFTGTVEIASLSLCPMR